jgi:putative phage-type endonuclease
MSAAATLVGYLDPGSDMWLQARANALGGSEIAAVMGLSPFESRFSLWHRKAGRLGPVAETDEMYWGKALEPVIAAEFARRHPDLTVAPAGTWRNRERHWQIGAPDGLVGDDLLEVKTARYDDEWGEQGTDVIPVYYRAQVLWYLDCLGYRRCHIAVLITGSDYREYLVQLDDAAMVDVLAMRAAAQEFMGTIAAGQRPEIDGHTATYQAVRELHPDIRPGQVEVPADVALPYLDALVAHRDAEDAKRRASARLLDAMAGTQRATYMGQTIASLASRGDGDPYVCAARGAANQHRSAAA